VARIVIGTSGWYYDHWIGPFYPEGMRPEAFLPYYAERFAAAEINNTFYQLPHRETLESWRDATPREFAFACKASRYITHMKKLKDPRDSIRRFMAVTEALGDKLGPILFQLPPRWHVDVGRLADFLDALPAGRRYAFELRDESWFCDAVYEALKRHGAAFCVYDLDGRRSPVRSTADFVYVRLHGPRERYRGRYDGRTLFGWARRFRHWRDEGLDVYCFFDNDENGYAPRDALRLKQMFDAR
jgi:uncharacterized protein YecE (DUF72 family)